MRVPGTGAVKIFVPDLLENDSDPEGKTISLVTAQLPATSANGSALSVLSSGRWIIYTPSAPAPVTDDSFTYQIQDPDGATATATVTVDVKSPTGRTRNNIRAAISGNDIALEFRGIPGRKYKIQYTTSMVEPVNWTDASGTITADSRGRLNHTDLNAAAVHGSRFFRTIEVDE